MEPLVSIIVTSYVPESKHYLDLCVRSIQNLSYSNIETIIVGRQGHNMPEYPNAKTIAPPEESFWNGHGINYGVEHSLGEYLFIINDDVILTKDCVQPLIKALELPVVGQVMPAGNDQQFRYHWPDAIHAFERAGRDPSVLMHQRSTQTPTLIFAETLCLYAHMLKRTTWNKVGPMDDSSGLIDIDYSIRMRQAGLLNAIELSSLVWHFSGASVVHTLNDNKRLKQREQFEAKWGWVP